LVDLAAAVISSRGGPTIILLILMTLSSWEFLGSMLLARSSSRFADLSYLGPAHAGLSAMGVYLPRHRPGHISLRFITCNGCYPEVLIFYSAALQRQR